MKLEIRGAENLSFRERQVVVLKESGATTESIARQLQLTPSSIGTLYNRAKAKGYEVVIILPGTALGITGADEEGEINDGSFPKE